jgi:hypothetical protein
MEIIVNGNLATAPDGLLLRNTATGGLSKAILLGKTVALEQLELAPEDAAEPEREIVA